MTIRRGGRQSHAAAPLKLVNDARLSFKARGLGVYLLTKPEDWRVSAALMVAGRVSPDGRQKILAGLKELEVAGYLVRRRWQGEGGKWNTESVMFETPEEAQKWSAENGFSAPGEADREPVTGRRLAEPRSPEVGEPAPVPLVGQENPPTPRRRIPRRQPSSPEDNTVAALAARSERLKLRSVQPCHVCEGDGFVEVDGCAYACSACKASGVAL